MATEKELELLDNYLANRLNTKEKADFEQKLEADPNLRTEFEFQQRLIQGIRNARATELKSMLNNIPVSAIEASETTWVSKVVTGCVIAGLLGTGLYFVLNQEKEEKHETSVVNENKVTPPKETTDEPQKEYTPAPVQQEQQSVKIEKETTSKTIKDSDSATSTTQGKVAEKRKLEVFDPTHEMEATTKQNNSEIESGSVATTSSIAVETDNTNKKYTFNYQFKDGKLFLYGSFERNLYEILEFFDESKRTVFLYYKDNYYLLDEDSQKVKSLTPITDPVLLKKLKEHRGS
jgi:hypothetical protein